MISIPGQSVAYVLSTTAYGVVRLAGAARLVSAVEVSWMHSVCRFEGRLERIENNPETEQLGNSEVKAITVRESGNPKVI